jgi:hypothetical protein
MTIVQIIVICLACFLLFGRLFFGVFKRFSPFDSMRRSGQTAIDKSGASNVETPVEDDNNNNNNNDNDTNGDNYQAINARNLNSASIANDENRVKIEEPTPLSGYQPAVKSSDMSDANDAGVSNSNDLLSNNRYQYQRTKRSNTTTGVYEESTRRTYVKHANKFNSVRKFL